METYISISEMAKLHGLTRQTLIHYDSIDLFKPIQVDDKGYRFYSKYQIPYLREICFLKSMGIGLKDIVEHFQERSPEKEMVLLQKQKQYVISQIAKFNTIREYLNQRIDFYEEAVDANAMMMEEPFLKDIGERHAIFQEFDEPINKEKLHTTLMSLWKKIFARKMVPSSGFGAIIRMQGIESRECLKGAGSCIFLPRWSADQHNTITIPAGTYACMYKYGMPYDIIYIKKMLQWLEVNGYELAGDIIDVCLLDTTFYKQEIGVDFCMLQAPIKNN